MHAAAHSQVSRSHQDVRRVPTDPVVACGLVFLRNLSSRTGCMHSDEQPTVVVVVSGLVLACAVLHEESSNHVPIDKPEQRLHVH
jgi:hypothetical protein